MGLLGSLALGGTSTPALADGDEAASSGFSGYVTLTSDYRFRGISQSDTGAALQADVMYTLDCGAFFEVWASNVDFSAFGDPDTSIEIDLTAGYGIALTDFTDVSIKAVYYLYPNSDVPSGADDINYWEIIGGISRKMGSTLLSLEAAYTPEYGSDQGAAWAVTGGVSFPLWKQLWFLDGVDASGHFGVQTYDEIPSIAPPDYTFWDLGLTANLGDFALDARYVDTDLDDLECGLEVCETGFVFSATVAFGG